jgi:PAS domain S-box-containing protein
MGADKTRGFEGFDIGEHELSDIIDVPALQSMMDDLYAVTKIGFSIIDLKGKVLVGTGWQEICIKFHRVNARTLKNCLESDLVLTSGVKQGEFRAYKCRNNMWDIVTPLFIAGKHVGNVYSGQFFFEGDKVDREVFVKQAKKYGFNEKEYLAALDRVPIWNRETINNLMRFYTKLSEMISKLSFSNIKLAKSLSDEELAEVALRNSEERWSTTLTSIGDAVIATDIDGNVTFMNEVAERLTGWTFGEAAKKPINAVFKIVKEKTGKEVESPVSRVLKEGTIVGLANDTILVRKNGEKVAIDDSGAPIRDSEGNVTGVVLVFRDITESKESEEALRQSEERFSKAFNASPVAVIITRLRDGDYVDVNDTFLRMFEYSREEVIGHTSPGLNIFVNPTSSAEFLRILEAGGRIRDLEMTFRTKQGKPVGTIISSEKIIINNDECLLTTIVDISERKKAEEKLQKLNRTLRAISNSNQALMRARDEAPFLQEACRIIAEDCGYKMVWVGLAEDDPAKSVRPVAHYGFEKGYLDTLKLTWADNERGRGPTGRAIRTGQPQFCLNMRTDPAFAPWREEALKRGYASSSALPLKAGDKVFGALTMYSKEPNSCSEDEVKLLTELASDFAHGIMTLRLRAEQEKGQAEIRKQAALINLSPDGIIVRELEGTITFWSKGAEKMYGWKRKEAIGQNTHKLFKTKFPEPYEIVLAKLRQSGKWSGELVHTTKTGKQLTVQSWWQPKLDQQGEIVELMESNVDITERKLVERALERAKVDWERTFDSVPDLIAILDEKHKIVRANKAMADALGMTPEQCIGLPCYKYVHQLNFPPSFCPHSKALLDGQEHTAEVHEEALGGDFIVSATPLKDDQGRMIGSVHVARNITVRKQMEKKLEEYSRHLEQLVEERTKQLKDSERLAAIGATAGMVGHDIRNPLQAIIGDIFLAKSDLSSCPDSEEKNAVDESLCEIERNIEYINKIVADLQDFAKPLNPIAMQIDVKHTVDHVIGSLSIPENISLSVDIEEGAERIVADSAFLQRILSNLINNAVQAMPDGGKLAVHAFVEGRENVITVEDTGVGIPEEDKSKLFTPLFTTKSKGQGFGLAVVKRMTEALGGKVSFESREGKGTKFVVRLPKKPKGKEAPSSLSF